MKKILFLVLVPVMMAILIQCVSVPQRWPAYERRTEDRIFSIQQAIGNGLASGELNPNEARSLLAKLENIRREYTVLRERMTTAEEWDPLLGRLDDLEREVNRVRAQPPRIDETRIEDRMIVLQRRIDEEIMAGRVTRLQGREFQVRLDSIRRDFLQRIKDRPFTPEERAETTSRLDSLERDINRVW
jgi:chromosome segregation ATPase